MITTMTTMTTIPIRVVLPGRGALTAVARDTQHYRRPGCDAGMWKVAPCFPGCGGQPVLFEFDRDALWWAARQAAVRARMAELGWVQDTDTEEESGE